MKVQLLELMETLVHQKKKLVLVLVKQKQKSPWVWIKILILVTYLLMWKKYLSLKLTTKC